MSAEQYFEKISAVISMIQSTQLEKIEKAGELFAHSISADGRVYMFGSGHSVLPVLDMFPRYGSFIGFYPIYDPRLMWFNIIGPGGPRELLWLERQEGYARIVLSSYHLEPRDAMLVFSHGGLNAAPVEMAIEAKRKGLPVVSVSSLQNYRQAQATHSSGKKLPDVSDIAIDNCVPREDALVAADGVPERFAAGSTVASVAVAMALVADVGTRLTKRGVCPDTFVSPNVGLAADHNEMVYRKYMRNVLRRTT